MEIDTPSNLIKTKMGDDILSVFFFFLFYMLLIGISGLLNQRHTGYVNYAKRKGAGVLNYFTIQWLIHYKQEAF